MFAPFFAASVYGRGGGGMVSDMGYVDSGRFGLLRVFEGGGGGCFGV